MPRMGQIDTLLPAVNQTAYNKNVPEQLKPHAFKPGQSGNPSGRPRKPLTERLLKRLADEDEKLAERLVDALISRAEDSDPKAASASVRAVTEIFDRVEGKVEQKIDMKAGVYQAVDDSQLEQRLEALLAKRESVVECPAVSVETSVEASEAEKGT